MLWLKEICKNFTFKALARALNNLFFRYKYIVCVYYQPKYALFLAFQTTDG